MHSVLLAQDSINPWWVAALIPLATALGGAIAWAWNERKKFREEQDKKLTLKESTYVGQLEELIKRYETDRQDMLSESRKKDLELDKAFQMVSDMRVSNARCVGWIKFMQAWLVGQKINGWPRFEDGETPSSENNKPSEGPK